MKKYIIITRRVSNMGGAQLFVLRRAQHLKKEGYSVSIIVGEQNEYFPLNEKFSVFNVIVAPEIRYCVARTSKKQQDAVLCNILNRVGGAQSFLIESHTLTGIEWGELLAVRCNAKHLAYPLTEPRIAEFKFQPGQRIFEDKLNKGEFYGCTSTSLRAIFGRQNVPQNYVNIGFDETELVENTVPAITFSKKENDFVITTITRFEKTYIEHLADASAEMARKYPKQSFVLLVAGGSPNQSRVNYLTDNYNTRRYGLDNFAIQYLGYIKTLGKDFFDITDVFVGMGTSSINAISQRCITINIDPQDGMKYSSGIFGVDTKNFAYTETGNVFTILSKLEEVYLSDNDNKRQIQESGRKLYEEDFEIMSCFRKLDAIVNNLHVACYRELLRVPAAYRLFAKTVYNLRDLIRKS